MKRLFVAFLLCLPFGLFSQNFIIDSLKRELANASQDTSKVKFSLRLAFNLHPFNPDSALLLTQEAEQHVENISNPETRITGMRRVGHAYYSFKKTDKSLDLFLKAMELAKKAGHEEEIAFLLNNLGSAYRAKADYPKAIEFYEQSLHMNKERDNKGGQTVALNNLGAIFKEDLKEYDQAIAFFMQALAVEKITQNKVYQAAILYNISSAYREKNDYKETQNYLENSLHLYRELNDITNERKLLSKLATVHRNYGNLLASFESYQEKLGIEQRLGMKKRAGFTLRRIGNLYLEFGDHPMSIKFFQQELKVWEELDKKSSQATVYNSLGYNYVQQQQYDSAFVYLFKAIQLNEALGDQKKIAFPIYNLGSMYEKTNRLDSAEIFLERALHLAETNKQTQLQTLALSDLAQIDLKRSNSSQALEKMIKAYGLSQPREYPKEKLALSEELFKLYKSQKEPNLALQYLEKYIFFKDSVYNLERTREITQIGAKYEFEREKQQLTQMQAKEVSRQAAIQRNILVGLGVAILFIIILIWFYFSKQKANQKLWKLNEEILQQKTIVEHQNEQLKLTQGQLIQAEKMASLGQLTAGIAHEIKNPLNFVNNFAQFSQDLAFELQEGLGKHLDKIGQEDAALFDSLLEDLQLNTAQINQHGKRADRIVQSMMNHASGAKGERQKYDVNRLLKESTALAFKGYKVGKNLIDIDIELDLAPDLPLCSIVPPDISRVVVNLFNNACDALIQKHHPSQEDFEPRIKVSTRKQNDKLEIRFWDNGTGIPDSQRRQIFEPFFTSKPTGLGNTGLGLSISHDIIVHGHNGRITVESETDTYTEFIILLPLS